MAIRKEVVISERTVNTATSTGILRDAKLPGFCLKVTVISDLVTRKTYFVNAKIRGTRQNVTVTIGSSPLYSANKARQMAEEIIAQLKDGRNPNEDARQARRDKLKAKEAENSEQELSLQNLLDSYLEMKRSHQRESTQNYYRWTLNGACRDWLKLSFFEITNEMVLERYSSFVESRNIAKAESFRRVLRAIFRHAQRSSKYKAKFVCVPADAVRDEGNVTHIEPRRRIVEDEDLPVWFEAVSKLDDPLTREYFRLLLMSGLRKQEALGLRWADIEFDAKTKGRPDPRFTIYDTKNKRDLCLPITPILDKLFKRLLKYRDGEFVFSSRRSTSGHTEDVSRQLKKLVKFGAPEFDPHDLRRTFITTAARLLPELVVKRLVNHYSKSDVTQHHYANISAQNVYDDLIRVEQAILAKGKVNIEFDKPLPRKKSTK